MLKACREEKVQKLQQKKLIKHARRGKLQERPGGKSAPWELQCFTFELKSAILTSIILTCNLHKKLCFQPLKKKTTSNIHKCQLSLSLFKWLLTVPILLHDSYFRGISAFIYSSFWTLEQAWKSGGNERQIAKLYIPKSLDIHLNVVVKDDNIRFCMQNNVFNLWNKLVFLCMTKATPWWSLVSQICWTPVATFALLLCREGTGGAFCHVVVLSLV